MALANAGDGRHDLPGRAITALEGVLLKEGGLDWMKRFARTGKALDGRDRPAFDLHRQGEAGKDPLAINVHRARTALTLVASLLGTRQSEMLAQGIEQSDAG